MAHAQIKWRLKMKLVWIDPPSGWRYGFPKLWNKDTVPNCVKFLIDNGYPHEIVEDLGDSFFVRCWEPTDEDVAEYNSNNI